MYIISFQCCIKNKDVILAKLSKTYLHLLNTSLDNKKKKNILKLVKIKIVGLFSTIGKVRT